MLFKSLAHLVGCQKTHATTYHPAVKGMVERWHRSLKASLMCHNNNEWLDILPTVLLGLRTSVKKDIGATAAELVYGTTLRIPGKFFLDKDMAPDPKIFVEKFREHIRKVRSTLTAHHDRRKVNRVRKPLEPPYQGPYVVEKRISDHTFTISIVGKLVNVNVNRLKPAFTEVAASPVSEPANTPADEEPGTSASTEKASQPSTNQDRWASRTYPGPKKKKRKSVWNFATRCPSHSEGSAVGENIP
ncbi:uncharacterized protein LOC128885608 [Hylaeus anthracinus]|uniref:uncharacterized protein LOC128885608 n=1 Tax=Hylaeus anthracinus TaxID=313031 RepID=UPI0023B8F46C|nr:uncharacterized protein LOC128885608 [Hylaeus anthracinus]